MNNGYVYIIKKGHRFIKVGRSVDPDARIRQIETQGGFIAADFFISQLCSNYCKIETDMHKVLARHRKIGKWFEFSFGKAVEILKLQEYQSPMTEKEIKGKTQKQTELMIKMLGIKNGEETSEGEDCYHCYYCMCPTGLWEPLKTYNSDKGCQLYSDFLDIVWELEKRTAYNLEDILTRCIEFKAKYLDVKDFIEVVKEMIEIGIDNGAMTKYAKLSVIL